MLPYLPTCTQDGLSSYSLRGALTVSRCFLLRKPFPLLISVRHSMGWQRLVSTPAQCGHGCTISRMLPYGGLDSTRFPPPNLAMQLCRCCKPGDVKLYLVRRTTKHHFCHQYPPSFKLRTSFQGEVLFSFLALL